MLRQPLITKDGSHTIAIPEMNVTYHSIHGAIQESMHVFIGQGWNYTQPGDIAILEMGLGTGLNALLTLIEAEKTNKKVYYTALELYPLELQGINQLNYCTQLDRKELQPVFEQMHHCEWEKDISIMPYFTLNKRNTDLIDFTTDLRFHLIYFDAFAPGAQPQLWTKEIFEKLYKLLFTGGMLVTYCSKSDVRRNMLAAGFAVEKVQGPPGKREMLRAVRS
jgi:tRNA U34 5-methylaminomethyl-2-thiouridine-forming methyltransferase MnmC